MDVAMPLAHLSPKRLRCRPVRCASSAVGVVAVCASLVAATLAPAGLVAQSRYEVARAGDVVTLSDARTALVVRVLTPASNAYQMTVNGQDVIRRTWETLDDIRGRMGLNGAWGDPQAFGGAEFALPQVSPSLSCSS